MVDRASFPGPGPTKPLRTVCNVQLDVMRMPRNRRVLRVYYVNIDHTFAESNPIGPKGFSEF
jgi:hypothetical protein